MNCVFCIVGFHYAVIDLFCVTILTLYLYVDRCNSKLMYIGSLQGQKRGADTRGTPLRQHDQKGHSGSWQFKFAKTSVHFVSNLHYLHLNLFLLK